MSFIALTVLLASQMGGPPPEVRAKLTELQQIQGQLRTIQEKAIKDDPGLKKKIDGLQKEIEGHMVKKDPTLKKDLKRFNELDGQFKKAMSSGDQAAAQKLGPELQQIAQKLSAAQSASLQDPGLRKKAEAMEKTIVAAMKKADPKANELVARADKLRAELQAAMMQQQMQPQKTGP